VIVNYDGKSIEMNDELPLMVAKTEIGKKVAVDVVRGGSKSTVKVVVEELEEGDGAEQEQAESEENRLGVAVQDLSPELVALLGLTASQGVIVTDVAPDSAAESAGVRRRDVILEVDSKTVTNSEEFRKLVRSLEKNKPVLLLVLREKNTVFLTLRLE
jgi:serine protease Do